LKGNKIRGTEGNQDKRDLGEAGLKGNKITGTEGNQDKRD